MGFFSSIGKIIMGKPVFTVDEKKQKHVDKSTSQPNETVLRPNTPRQYDEHGRKIIPNVYVSRCVPRLDSDDMDVWAYVRNDSDFQVELQRVELLGKTQLVNHLIEPHSEVNTLLYSGDRPSTDDDHQAHLYYERVDTNDYFCADHSIRYKVEHDDTYSIVELDILRPVRDI